MKDMFLVAKRDKDSQKYVPLAFFDYENLKQNFDIIQSEESLSMVYRWTPCYMIDDYGTIISDIYYVIPFRENRWIPN